MRWAFYHGTKCCGCLEFAGSVVVNEVYLDIQISSYPPLDGTGDRSSSRETDGKIPSKQSLPIASADMIITIFSEITEVLYTGGSWCTRLPKHHVTRLTPHQGGVISHELKLEVFWKPTRVIDMLDDKASKENTHIPAATPLTFSPP